jgi:hypothetical protein
MLSSQGASFDGRAYALPQAPRSWDPLLLPFDHHCLPPLPMIQDPALHRLVFDRQAVQGETNWQDLALEGDSVLYLAALEGVIEAGWTGRTGGLAVS